MSPEPVVNMRIIYGEGLLDTGRAPVVRDPLPVNYRTLG
jgi:hypothetical protein